MRIRLVAKRDCRLGPPLCSIHAYFYKETSCHGNACRKPYEDRDPGPAIPVHFDTPNSKRIRGATTVTAVMRMAAPAPTINPVTVDTFQTPRGSEELKATTVTRFATADIPVAVHIWQKDFFKSMCYSLIFSFLVGHPNNFFHLRASV